MTVTPEPAVDPQGSARELTLETKAQPNETPSFGGLMLTPALSENYWAYRVLLSETQAIIGFPKFSTVGIGFAVEDADWNTNLPYTCDAAKIYEHIEENKGDDSITREDCIRAIEMIQAAIKRAASAVLTRDWRAVEVLPGTAYLDEPSELMEPGWFVCAAWSDDAEEGAGLILKVDQVLEDRTGWTAETLAKALADRLNSGAA